MRKKIFENRTLLNILSTKQSGFIILHSFKQIELTTRSFKRFCSIIESLPNTVIADINEDFIDRNYQKNEDIAGLETAISDNSLFNSELFLEIEVVKEHIVDILDKYVAEALANEILDNGFEELSKTRTSLLFPDVNNKTYEWNELPVDEQELITDLTEGNVLVFTDFSNIVSFELYNRLFFTKDQRDILSKIFKRKLIKSGYFDGTKMR